MQESFEGTEMIITRSEVHTSRIRDEDEESLLDRRTTHYLLLELDHFCCDMRTCHCHAAKAGAGAGDPEF